MNYKFLKYLIVPLVVVQSAQAASNDAIAVINWADDFGSVLIDSTGLTDALLDSATYQIQLGTFEGPGETPFTPDATNYDEWQSNWKVFDQAEFNSDFGYFTGGFDSGSVMNGVDGTSLSPDATPNFDFSNHEAYIWVFNQQTATETTEWFLGRVSTWVFPDAATFADCCGPDYDQSWSLSTDDTEGTVDVVFGGYKDYISEGAGTYANAERSYLIQTYTIIPELSTLTQSLGMVLSVFAFVVTRRKKGNF